MRIIAGQAKNKRLKAPPGLNTRPITDMIKEAFFNVIGSVVEGSEFLDLFSGSGSVGIEALSRGAHKVVFVDSGSDAIKTIKSNLANCGFDKGFEVYRNDVFKAVQIMKKREFQFDYIFVDPPFTNEPIFDKVLLTLDQTNLLKDDGIMVIRSQRKKDLPDQLSNLKKYRLNQYGESTLHYYQLFRED